MNRELKWLNQFKKIQILSLTFFTKNSVLFVTKTQKAIYIDLELHHIFITILVSIANNA